MQYGLCPLSVVPVRLLPDESSELITQLLYGEYYKIIEARKFYSKIRIVFDDCEGWICNSQIQHLSQDVFNTIDKIKDHKFSSDLVSFVSTESNLLIPIIIGSSVTNSTLLKHQFDGEFIQEKIKKKELITIASLYLNAPFLWGGKTPFGIDCSGFTQMVYKIAGHHLLRSALQQSTQGEALSFIEESEPGDLAFFDDSNGIINHVGIIMQNNYIIHASGKVRVDRLDHTGIFNTEKKLYTHKLRVIKKVF